MQILLIVEQIRDVELGFDILHPWCKLVIIAESWDGINQVICCPRSGYPLGPISAKLFLNWMYCGRFTENHER